MQLSLQYYLYIAIYVLAKIVCIHSFKTILQKRSRQSYNAAEENSRSTLQSPQKIGTHHHSDIRLTKQLRQSNYLNPGPSEYAPQMLSTRPRHSV